MAELTQRTLELWGSPRVEPEPWQQFIIASLYGWRRVDNNKRRFRKAYIQVARKNGKSFLAAGVSLYDLITEPGAEVYSAATKKDQARIVFDDAKKTVQYSKDLKKYTSEFMKGERTVDVDGKQLTVDNLIDRRKDSAIERFVLGATEDMRYIHEKIGKKNKDGTYDGEKLTEADEKTTAEVRSAIEKFATAKIPEGGNLEDLKREFANDIARLKAEAKDDGRDASWYR